ncbi:TetR/AcrR family transcriptional regulator [Nocardia tengchongensis]|uniref:TetR/AcrR family transcriptional regulator n=1 Tax=Nocardia tengchongensis TaxID=2055889 RepID=UPI0036ADE612
MGRKPLGRPRDPERHRAVLKAAADLLVERGYEAMTLSEVASKAGVGRPLIYQWWGSKAALVQEVLFRMPEGVKRTLAPGAGFAEIVAALISEMVDLHSRPEFRRGLPGLISDMVGDPELQKVTEERFIAPLRARYVELFDRAKAEGVVRPDIDGGAVLDTLRGAAMFHTLVHPMENPEALVEHLTTLVLDGVRVA